MTVLDVDADPATSAARREHWTLVIGIVSVDRDASRERRQLQRATWLQYAAVASAVGVSCRAEAGDDRNATTGARVLHRFLLGLHPSHDYQVSAAARSEAATHSDVIVLNMREGRPNNKTVGGAGYWGLEAEVGMSRKAWLWYSLAPRYDADFIAKADDDLFLRANVIAATLRAVALDAAVRASCAHVYWGRVMKWMARKGDAASAFRFAGGMFVLMSRSLALWVAQSPVAAVNNREPFHGDRERYKRTNSDHEDVMVGRWLYDARLRGVCLVADCRFHDVHVGANKAPVRDASVGMHHLRVDEYHQFMTRFADNDTASRAGRVCAVAEQTVGRLREPRPGTANLMKKFSVC